MSHRIHIAIPSSNEYFDGLLVACLSISHFSENHDLLSFHIIDGGISYEKKKLLISKLKKISVQISCDFTIPQQEIFDKYPTYKGNKLTYSRLFLAELLPDVEKIVFVDADTLWFAPIEMYWKHISENTPLVARVDPGDLTVVSENNWYLTNGLESPGNNYFCAGILGINLEWIRNNQIISKAADFVSRFNNINYAEQTILNFFSIGKVYFVEQNLHLITKIDVLKNIEIPFVFHYAGELPWIKKTKSQHISDAEVLWYNTRDVLLGNKETSNKSYNTKIQYLVKRIQFKISPVLYIIFNFIKNFTVNDVIRQIALNSSYRNIIKKSKRSHLLKQVCLKYVS
jgi:lipopolysaccharide biosynthesis glycosyltransferase